MSDPPEGPLAVTTPASPAPTSPAVIGGAGRAVAIATGMTGVMVFVLAARITGNQALDMTTWVFMLATFVLALPVMGRREFYLLGLCGLIALAVLRLNPDPAAVFAAALSQAAFLMAFILLLGLLYEAAVTSPSVSECGPFITRQPPGRRYFTLFLGTGGLAVLFNAGIVSFLIPLVKEGVWSQSPEDPLNPLRERRQINALLRGFAWSVTWSPTALAPLMLMELIPGIDRQLWLISGMAIFLAMMGVGALEDRIQHRSARIAQRRQVLPFPTGAASRLMLAGAWLLGLALTARWATGESMGFGLMVTCPIMLFGWIFIQNGVRTRRGWRASGSRLGEIYRKDLPRAAPIALTLASAGFMGRAAAALVPDDAVLLSAALWDIPQFVVLWAIPPLLAIISLIGLSPIMMAVFLGSLLGQNPDFPLDPTMLALAISCGWALSMTFSPLATIVLLINRAGNIDPITLTWKWNLIFTAIAALALGPVFYGISRIAAP